MTTKEERIKFRNNNIEQTIMRCRDLIKWSNEWLGREMLAEENKDPNYIHPYERSLLVLMREARSIDVEMARALINDQDLCDPVVCTLIEPKQSFGYYKCEKHNLSWTHTAGNVKRGRFSDLGWEKFRFENDK